MLISTFELLLKPQFPKAQDPSTNPELPKLPPHIEQLARNVVQGYFLTIANVNSFDVTLSLTFTSSLTPPLTFKNLLDVLDVTGTNLVGPLVPEIFVGNKQAKFTLTIPAQNTALFLLQPDFVTNPDLLEKANFEVRGYVEASLVSLPPGEEAASLLLAAEQRGTFFRPLKVPLTSMTVETLLDQIAYNIPINGGPLVKLTK